MPLSRRSFVADASLLALLTALMPELAIAADDVQQSSTDDTPHDSYDFWNGFFDSVNPLSPNYGQKAASRGPTDQLPDPTAETQYLHYNLTSKRLRYATDVEKEELLDHDGDVEVGIALSQFRPATGPDSNLRPSQLRIDTTQIHPYMNIIAPLAWTAIASLEPNKAGRVSLEQLGFRSDQAMSGTRKILLTRGTGKLAVNVSKAASTSVFVKALNIIMQGTKVIAPMVTLPAISVPALSAFTQALSYWEDRTKFIMSGNLTAAVATQQAFDDPDREDRFIGLVEGDYLMVPQRHTGDLAKEIPNLDVVQGYLVRKDSDPSQPLDVRAQSAVPGITYASMRVTVQPASGSAAHKPGSGPGGDSGGGFSSSGKSGSGSKKGSGKGSGKGNGKGAGKGNSSGKSK